MPKRDIRPLQRLKDLLEIGTTAKTITQYSKGVCIVGAFTDFQVQAPAMRLGYQPGLIGNRDLPLLDDAEFFMADASIVPAEFDLFATLTAQSGYSPASVEGWRISHGTGPAFLTPPIDSGETIIIKVRHGAASDLINTTISFKLVKVPVVVYLLPIRRVGTWYSLHEFTPADGTVVSISPTPYTSHVKAVSLSDTRIHHDLSGFFASLDPPPLNLMEAARKLHADKSFDDDGISIIDQLGVSTK